MEKKLIRVMIKKVDEPIYEAAIDGSLTSYYCILDCNLIEYYYPFEEKPDICCIIDMCGRLDRKLVSWRIPESKLGINGTVIFAKDDGMGNTIGLNDEDVEFVKKNCRFAHYSTFESDFVCKYTFVGW